MTTSTTNPRPPYGRHARAPGPRTTVPPLGPHAAEYGIDVCADGPYVRLTFADHRRPVYLTVNAVDSLASALLKAGRRASAAARDQTC